MSELPPPPIPLSVDLADFPCMMLDIGRLRGSEFDALGCDAAWRAGVNLWLSSWHQVPAGSLKGSDEQLAKLAGLGRDLRTWRKVKADAMRGWTLCADGRFYHRVVCEVALEAWLSKLRQREKSGKGNERRWGVKFDRVAIAAERAHALDALKALQRKDLGPQRARIGAGEGSSPSDPSGTPPAIPREGKGYSVPTEQPRGGPPDLPGEAWNKAVEVFTTQGRMSDGRARSAFGKLLKETGLPPAELLPALSRCQVEGSQDPIAYMRRAAKGVADRLRERGGQLQPSKAERVAQWGADQWRVALGIFQDHGRWQDDWGPLPGEPGCIVPSAVLAEHGHTARVIPLPGRAAG